MILTVGDSFTYGSELLDKNSAWPYLLNKTVKNQGANGSSNDRIFRVSIEETCLNKFDFVIVAWSFTNRKEVYQKDNIHNGPICINHSFDNNLSWVTDYFKQSYNKDFAFQQWITQVIALQSYFKHIDQKYIFCMVEGIKSHEYTKYSDSIGHLLNKVDKDFYLGWPHIGMIDMAKNTPKGPQGHFLEQGHKLVAEKINEHIRNLGWIS
jgi:hypothetical protein